MANIAGSTEQSASYRPMFKGCLPKLHVIILYFASVVVENGIAIILQNECLEIDAPTFNVNCTGDAWGRAMRKGAHNAIGHTNICPMYLIVLACKVNFCKLL